LLPQKRFAGTEFCSCAAVTKWQEAQGRGGVARGADGGVGLRAAQKTVRGDYKFPEGVPLSETCRDLIRRIFVVDPRARITLDGIKRHPWFLQTLYPELRVDCPPFPPFQPHTDMNTPTHIEMTFLCDRGPSATQRLRRSDQSLHASKSARLHAPAAVRLVSSEHRLSLWLFATDSRVPLRRACA